MEFIQAHFDIPGDEPVIGDAYTVQKPYGWIFLYGSRRFVETGDPSAQLAGNGPVVVLETGEVVALPSAFAVEEAVRRFEAERGLTA